MEKGKALIRVYTGTENNAILLKERLEEAGISAIIKNDSEDAFFLIAPQVVDLYIQEEDKQTAEKIIRDFVLTNPAK